MIIIKLILQILLQKELLRDFCILFLGNSVTTMTEIFWETETSNKPWSEMTLYAQILGNLSVNN